MAYGENMENKYNWRGEAFANFVIAMVLLALVINAGLVIGFQRITAYTCGSQEEIMAEQGAYTLLDSVEYASQWNVENRLYTHLIRTEAGQIRLITLEKHFLLDRYRLVSDEAVDSAEFETVLHADSETRTVNVRNQQEIIPGGRTSKMFGLIPGLEVPTKVWLWVLGLFAIEILITVVVIKLRRS